MLPVLAVFIDGLRPDSVVHMPFLSSFAHKRPLQTELGYSITCHATMYSGVHPDKHLLWFAWQHAPATSPFRWTRYLGVLSPLDNVYLRYACCKATRQFVRNSSFTGLPFLVNAPLKYWQLFDVAETKMWDAPGYLRTYPTVFDILRSRSVPFTVLGFDGPRSGQLDLIRESDVDPASLLTYVFIGEVDNYSHKHGQSSDVAIARLKDLDIRLQALYESSLARHGQVGFLCWSDHGHARVDQKLDLYDWFEQHGSDLRQYVHLIDTTFARFWFRSSDEAARVIELLSTVEGGRLLAPELLDRYHCLMPDNRYGDLIFYLDAPRMFTKTVWGYGKRTVSIHGYLPSMAEMDGVFVSNIPVKPDIRRVSLVDILPSIASLLDQEIPSYVDGSTLWED